MTWAAATDWWVLAETQQICIYSLLTTEAAVLCVCAPSPSLRKKKVINL